MNMSMGTSMVIPMTETRDWQADPIANTTVIDAGYRKTQNVRRFFKTEIGEHFKSDRPFMTWFKAHTGATMADAVAEWRCREAAR